LQWRRDWLLASVVCLSLLALRSWFYLGWEEAFFHSDQAIVGLMAKHLAERRAWPLFYYGQEYLLAVEAWLAAPLTLVMGSTVASLRLAVIVLNAVTGLLLLRLLVREAGLDLWSAVLASCPFWIAPVIPAANLVEAGANIDPFLWVLVAWAARRQPLWLGVCLGFGFLNREFTLYVVPPLVVSQAIERRRIDPPLIGSWVLMASGFLLVLQMVTALKRYADIYGPGTAGLRLTGRSVTSQLLERVVWEPGLLRQQLLDMLTDYLPFLLGIPSLPPGLFGIATPLIVGWPMLQPPLAIVAVVIVAWLATNAFRARRFDQAVLFPLCMVAVGVIAAGAYVMFRPYTLTTTRYGLLLLYAPIGVAALALHPSRAVVLRALAAAALAMLATGSAIDHARVIATARVSPPKGPIRAIVNRLERDGTMVVWADYWHAYTITFLSQERVTAATIDVPRIAEYATLAGRAEAANERIAVIQREPCSGGEFVGDVYICPR
jgi:hypothetical protein